MCCQKTDINFEWANENKQRPANSDWRLSGLLKISAERKFSAKFEHSYSYLDSVLNRTIVLRFPPFRQAAER
jgi:hypothetical protein